MNSEGRREDLKFSLEELFEEESIRLSGAIYPPLYKATTNLKRIITPGDLDIDWLKRLLIT